MSIYDYMKIKYLSRLTALSMLFTVGIAFGGDNFCSHCGAPLKRVKEEARYRPCLPPPCCERICYEDCECKECRKDKEFFKDKIEHCSKDKQKKHKAG